VFERRVLIADGDAKARAETASLLTDRGYEVHTTGWASEAQVILKNLPCACAVVDVELEDVPGLQAADMFRAVDPGLPLVITARKNTKEVEAQVRRQDVVYYYVKGFDRQELVQAVGGAVARRKRGAKTTILVVDDDHDYQAVVRRILEGSGYEVLSAYTKDEGLEMLRETLPDLVILDIMMTRRTDGFYFLYEMKADRKAVRPPVLSVSVISEETGFPFSPTEEDGYFPADDFLAKPVRPAELIARVEALLNGYRPLKHKC